MTGTEGIFSPHLGKKDKAEIGSVFDREKLAWENLRVKMRDLRKLLSNSIL